MAIWKQNTTTTKGFTVNATTSGVASASTQGNWGDTSYTWNGSNVVSVGSFSWANVTETFNAVWKTGVTIGKSVFKSN